MKKLLLLSFLAFFLILSCKKSETPANPYFMKAMIDSIPYSSSTCNVGIDSLNGLLHLLIIASAPGGTARVPSYPEMYLNINNWNGSIGTFVFNGTTNYGQYFATLTSTETSQSGSITITSISATAISGTFSFICYDSTVVSNGAFVASR